MEQSSWDNQRKQIISYLQIKNKKIPSFAKQPYNKQLDILHLLDKFAYYIVLYYINDYNTL